MAEASWGEAPSPINWRMSAALENVPRGASDMAEVTSLQGVVRAWLELDPDHQRAAVLTPERQIQLDGATLDTLSGEQIAALAAHLPASDAEG